MLQYVKPIAETCDNCERMIGRDETPNVWREHVVCADCHERLAERSIAMAFSAPRRLAASDRTGSLVAILVIAAIMVGGSALMGWMLLLH